MDNSNEKEHNVTKDRAMLASAVTTALNLIGYDGDSKRPRITVPKGVNDADAYKIKANAVWDFFVTSRIRSIVNTRFEKQKEVLGKLGVLDKCEKMVAGDDQIIYKDEVIALQCKVNKPSSRLNEAKLVVEMVKRGLSHEKASEIIRASMEENAAPRVLTPTIITAD